MKAKQNFKYYNNTFLYVTIREPYLKLKAESGEPNVLRSYYSASIKLALEHMQPKLRKAFDDHLQLTISSLDDLAQAANILKGKSDNFINVTFKNYLMYSQLSS